MEITLEEFQKIVDETVASLPDEFKNAIENVDISVEVWPNWEDLQAIHAHPGTLLFGLYKGIPKTRRGLYYSATLPDKILIFAGPILSTSQDLDSAKNQIKNTVMHEIGHHLGMSEEDIRKAESNYKQ